MKKIVTHEHWSFDSIRSMCIREDFYTRGTSVDYMELLDMVSDSEPASSHTSSPEKAR